VTHTGTGLWPVLFCLFACSGQTQANDPAAALPAISIIIDDLGKRLSTGRRVMALPGPVACSFLPRAPYTGLLADAAKQSGKEVMLHLPMDSVDGRQLDQGAVTLDMSEQQFVSVIRSNLSSVPHVTGINNHMGSLLTRHPGHMLWLMRAIQHRAPLFFVDSRTTEETVARRVAQENGVPSLERDVFLDNSLEEHDIVYQFRRLLQLAHKQGTALAIGHPHPQTLAVLEQQIPELKRQGIRLVPVGELIGLQQEVEHRWQASWSPSHKAVKN
jgi:polysaccharide deacetylase 2 family uncharacterized protein YibQ